MHKANWGGSNISDFLFITSDNKQPYKLYNFQIIIVMGIMGIMGISFRNRKKKRNQNLRVSKGCAIYICDNH